MAVFAIDQAFLHQAEFGIEFTSDGLLDTCVVSRLLITELVARERQDLEAAIPELFMYLN